MKNILSKCLIIVGLIFILFGSGLYIQTIIPTTIDPIGAKETTNSLYPLAITINSINVNLPIIPAAKTNGKFETTKNGVTYLTDSVLPAQTGNSVFYGHNWSNLLGNLKNVKRGDTIELKYSNGEVKTFTVDLITEMPAEYAKVSLDSNQKVMTIYTCSGFLDSKRIIVTANYTGTVI